MREVHVVYDEGGRIVAVADAAEASGPGGLVLRHQPVPGPGQHSIQLTLDDHQAAAGPAALIRDFEVDQTTSPPAPRRRAR